MKKEKLQTLIQGKTLKDKNGISYQFIPESTLKINNDPRNIFPYRIYEENQKLFMNQNNAVSNEDLEIVIECEDPLELSFTTKLSSRPVFTLKERI
ncbi:MAG TPA: hypothetical protein PLN13_03400 [Bacteroidia bacterium]|nr:hypothetical protein [Bacteroidia bacterium]HRH07600.1 hypothetical protein [Bacteroidia bacterium]